LEIQQWFSFSKMVLLQTVPEMPSRFLQDYQ